MFPLRSLLLNTVEPIVCLCRLDFSTDDVGTTSVQEHSPALVEEEEKEGVDEGKTLRGTEMGGYNGPKRN